MDTDELDRDPARLRREGKTLKYFEAVGRSAVRDVPSEAQRGKCVTSLFLFPLSFFHSCLPRHLLSWRFSLEPKTKEITKPGRAPKDIT